MAASLAILDRTFHLVMGGYVESGRAPHFTDVARALGVTVEEARQALVALMATPGIAGWFHPGAEIVASVAPFYSLASQYRVTVNGQQRWFAQCGFEATAMSLVFPGRLVRVDAACLDCNDPIVLTMRDGAVVSVDPPGTLGHLNHPVRWIGTGPRDTGDQYAFR